MKLNLGCGTTKLQGYLNIDAEKSCKPDLVLDFVKKRLPQKDGMVEEILFFHCIEHIQKSKHRDILLECSRVLKPGGKIYISFPDFWECAKRWHDNVSGQKRFWEATLYGRQLYPGDFHVCAMDTAELILMLYECGFGGIKAVPETDEPYNKLVTAVKVRDALPTYETLVAQDIKSMKVVKCQ